MSITQRPHFGTDGIRGNAEQELTNHFVYALGKAIGSAIIDEHPDDIEFIEIIIGRDTRRSGERILYSLASGLSSLGINVVNIGILPTPGISLNAEKRNSYACAITASHNPVQDNGIKVFSQGGVKTDEIFEEKIESLLNKFLQDEYDTDNFATIKINDNSKLAYETYINWLHSVFETLSLSGLTIALDCANGASCKPAPEIFTKLDANVLAINTQENGININNKCGATNLESLTKFVNTNPVDIAFAFDGDADRIIVLDENAKIYNGDHILALFALNQNLDPKTVVATSMSNGGLKQFLNNIDTNFIETEVGDKNVTQAMKVSSSKIGGEQSGHIIHSDYAFFGDGVLIALLISEIYAKKKKIMQKYKSSELLNLFEPMVQIHEKVQVSNKALAATSINIEEAIKQHLFMLGENARIVIRPSGTENIVRIMVEADEKDMAEKSIIELIDIVKESCKE